MHPAALRPESDFQRDIAAAGFRLTSEANRKAHSTPEGIRYARAESISRETSGSCSVSQIDRRTDPPLG
jgi:hypothetical protein